MSDLIAFLAFYTLSCKRSDRNDRSKNTVKFIQIPLFRIYIIRETHINISIHCILDHLIDCFTHILTVENLTTFFVDDLTLFIVYLVIIKKILTDTKVVKLNLLLSFLNCIGKHLVLNLFILCNTKGCKDLHQSLRTEQTHQVIFQGNIETGFTRISLTSGTSAKLIINTSGLMTFCTDDHQTTCISCHIIQLDICTTTSHVSGDRNCSCLTCL